MQMKSLYLPFLAFTFTASLNSSLNLRPVAALSFSHGFGAVLGGPPPRSEDMNVEDFWTRARGLGEGTDPYTDILLARAAERSLDAREKCATALREELRASGPGTLSLQFTLEQDLQVAFGTVVEELKVMFPAVEKTGRARREEVVGAALGKAGMAFMAVFRTYGMPEELTQAHWADLRREVETTVLLIGDLVEQHADLTPLLFTGALRLIPEYWLLRPLLGLFGFGPTGPGNGTQIAWAQRALYGAAVKNSDWLALLDLISKIMLARATSDFTGKIVCALFLIVIAAIFCGGDGRP
ncbi:hypothetical protein B0H17DRAFT_1178846 [Mycena rosella]|uniref:Uncharacterized protein n=1 Tax=Mycena rosella TaxID=1033263 RepID=A0AAD7DKL3_MYCRO|nr:hypothetical protein B0H17DRAFT_1178846 [Mycena rosella]